jgi:hypothetical protein
MQLRAMRDAEKHPISARAISSSLARAGLTQICSSRYASAGKAGNYRRPPVIRIRLCMFERGAKRPGINTRLASRRKPICWIDVNPFFWLSNTDARITL